MQKIYYKFEDKKYLYGAAFLLPFLLYGVMLVALGVSPFGERSILVTDMHSQYVQFYTYLHDVLKGEKSIFYSWEAGMGLNFYGVVAYYLASPFSLIVVFFDRNSIPEFLALLTLLKIGLAGLSMSYFLSKVYNFRGLPIVFFSTFYALMSFVTVYGFCIMWLDGIFLLPVVLFGIEKLLKDNKYILLTISLAVLFISNFYIAFMAGMFTFLYFVCKFFVIYQFKDVRLFVKKFFYFCMSTLIAAGISAVITIPTYKVLSSNFIDRDKTAFTTEFNFDLLTFYSRLFSGVIDTTINGLPNVYAGVLTLLLVPLFFMSKKILLKEKVIWGALIAFLLLSFELPFLDLAWHAFQPPTNFPYRYSFVFSFLLLFLAIRMFIIFDESMFSSLRKVVLFNLFMIILLGSLSNYYMPTNKILINSFLVLAYGLLLYGKVKLKGIKEIISLSIALIVCLDVGLNTIYMTRLLNYEYGYINREAYAEPVENYSEVFKEIKNKDQSLYRVETILGSTWNDSLQFDYRGITHFNTVANGHLNLYMQDLGYGYLETLILRNGKGIVSTDALFGIKYMVTNRPLNKHGFEQIDQIGKLRIYENNNALPFGYMVDQNLFDTSKKTVNKLQKVNYTNSFEVQNELMGGEYFNAIDPASVEYNNLEQIEKSTTKAQTKEKKVERKTYQEALDLVKINEYEPASIKYTFDVQGKQQLYMKLRVEPTDYTNVYVNGKSLGKKFSQYPTYYWNNGVLDLGAFKDEQVEVEIKVTRDSLTFEQYLFYGLDMTKFESQINELEKQALEVTHFNSRSLTGSIDVTEVNQTLFLSIPFDEGWTAKVDGQEVEVKKLNGAFIGIELTKGNHDIELKYTPPGFKIGMGISIVSVTALIFLIRLNRKAKK